jgi:N-acetylmuramic acid 6-phosphate etherase
MRETERRHQQTIAIDLLETGDVVQTLMGAHADVPHVVSATSAVTATAVDGAVRGLTAGGRLIFAGSGTPGALVESDASELSPTFGFPRERLAIVRARSSQEAGPDGPDEDDRARGARAVDALRPGGDDVVVAVASSGDTPFTLGAATAAAGAGAFVVGVCNVPRSDLAAIASVAVELGTGPEPLMGSTRMRAGLSQRMWLTVFSTAVMIRLGLTYDNMMVNVAPVLEKLRARRLTILAEATGFDERSAAAVLDRAGDDLRVALVMALSGTGRDEARAALACAGGRVRGATAATGGER